MMTREMIEKIGIYFFLLKRLSFFRYVHIDDELFKNDLTFAGIIKTQEIDKTVAINTKNCPRIRLIRSMVEIRVKSRTSRISAVTNRTAMGRTSRQNERMFCLSGICKSSKSVCEVFFLWSFSKFEFLRRGP